MKLRIACLQFNPIIGKVDQNVNRIKNLLSKANKQIDLLVLPELSITGYNFHSPKEIEPYLEFQGKGRSFELANELSMAYKCTTVIGYPETRNGTTYNAAMVVDQSGKLVTNYRKTHMYEADENWGCSENPDDSFPGVTLRFPGENGESLHVRSNIGICMDLNPKQFKAPFYKFEFSMKAWSNDSSLIIVPTAWLSSDSPSQQNLLPPSDKKSLTNLYRDFVNSKQGKPKDDFKNNLVGDSEVSEEGENSALVQDIFEKSDYVVNSTKASKSLVDYWIIRFFPYLSHPLNIFPKKNHKTTLVLCNRSGIEDDIVYGGSSSILQFNPSSKGNSSTGTENPSVHVLASAGQVTEEVIYHEVDL